MPSALIKLKDWEFLWDVQFILTERHVLMVEPSTSVQHGDQAEWRPAPLHARRALGVGGFGGEAQFTLVAPLMKAKAAASRAIPSIPTDTISTSDSDPTKRCVGKDVLKDVVAAIWAASAEGPQAVDWLILTGFTLLPKAVNKPEPVDARDGFFIRLNPRDNTADRPMTGKEFLQLLSEYLVLHTLLAGYGGSGQNDLGPWGLPALSYFIPQPEVSLDATRLHASLQKANLYFPWHVLHAASVALTSGRHLILTGPPGCGKTELAVACARIAMETAPLVCTANASWTTGDLIGRYFPAADGSGRLDFQEGFFLQAIRNGSQWLIIDELNRAPIDECFGDLFTVLAGQPANLPFVATEEREDSDDTAAAESVDAAEAVGLATNGPSASGTSRTRSTMGVRSYAADVLEGAKLRATSDPSDTSTPSGKRSPIARRLRIVPPSEIGTERHFDADQGLYKVYNVPSSFRIIATMNDSDRHGLHQLSYALQRRFHVIAVEPPDRAGLEAILRGVHKRKLERFKADQQSWRLSGEGTSNPKLSAWLHNDVAIQLDRKPTCLVGLLTTLFIGRTETDTRGLVSAGIVGVSSMQAVHDFVFEATRAPREHRELIVDPHDAGVAAEGFILTNLALGLVLTVFPQLPAAYERMMLDRRSGVDSAFEDRSVFDSVFELFLELFGSENIWQIQQVQADQEGEGPSALKLYLRQLRNRPIHAYLAQELARVLPASEVDAFRKASQQVVKGAGL